MSEGQGLLAALLVPLALGLGAIGLSDRMGSVEAGSATIARLIGQGMAKPLRCELRVTESGHGVVLEGIVVAKTAIEGAYRLRVSQAGGAGSSDIHQSGDFSAGPGAPSTLATITLGRGSYSAQLRVTWTGGSIECSEHVGGAL
jgi:hypothetical protein